VDEAAHTSYYGSCKTGKKIVIFLYFLIEEAREMGDGGRAVCKKRDRIVGEQKKGKW